MKNQWLNRKTIKAMTDSGHWEVKIHEDEMDKKGYTRFLLIRVKKP